MAEWTEERARNLEHDLRATAAPWVDRGLEDGWAPVRDLLAAWRAEKARADKYQDEEFDRAEMAYEDSISCDITPGQEIASLERDNDRLEGEKAVCVARAEEAEAKLRGALADLSDAAQRAAEMREDLIELTRQRDEWKRRAFEQQDKRAAAIAEMGGPT